jgi:hypothetical protein
MSENNDEHTRKLDARDNRRWLIGVAISVAFGLFGVVMALLTYSHRTSRTPSAAPTPAARSPGHPAPDGREHEARRQRR